MTLKKNKKVPGGYTFVGHFHSATANAIGLPGGDVFISRNYIKHIANRHGKELKQLGLSAVSYAKFVLGNFNRIYGDTPSRRTERPTCLFVIYNPELSHVAAVEMNMAPKEGFWEIHTVHPISIKQLAENPLLYEKKNAETASFSLP